MIQNLYNLLIKAVVDCKVLFCVFCMLTEPNAFALGIWDLL